MQSLRGFIATVFLIWRQSEHHAWLVERLLNGSGKGKSNWKVEWTSSAGFLQLLVPFKSSALAEGVVLTGIFCFLRVTGQRRASVFDGEGAGRRGGVGGRLHLEPERARCLPGRRELFKATMKPHWHTLGAALQWAGCAWLSVWLISFNTVRDWGTPGRRGRSCYLLRGSEVSCAWIDPEIPNQLRKHTNRNTRLRTNAPAEVRTQPHDNQGSLL